MNVLAAPAIRNRARWPERALFLIAFLAFAWVGATAADRFLYQRMESARLAEVLPGEETAQPSPIAETPARRSAAAALAADGVIGRITIPAAAVDAIVVQGVDDRTLRRAVGHVPSTALPGDSGNVALAGHRDTFFRGLRKLQLDDPIHLSTPAGTFDYRVEELRVVEPTETEVLTPGAEPILTLITCFPFDYVGSAPQRFVVRAREIRRPED